MGAEEDDAVLKLGPGGWVEVAAATEGLGVREALLMLSVEGLPICNFAHKKSLWMTVYILVSLGYSIDQL